MDNPVKVLVVCGTGVIRSIDTTKCIPLEKTENTIKYLKKDNTIEYTFIDIKPKPLVQCNNYLQIDFLKKLITYNLPKFDIIVLEYCPIASHIFEGKFYNIEILFGNINKLLQEGGFLIIPRKTYDDNNKLKNALNTFSEYSSFTYLENIMQIFKKESHITRSKRRT